MGYDIEEADSVVKTFPNTRPSLPVNLKTRLYCIVYTDDDLGVPVIERFAKQIYEFFACT